MTRPIAWTPIEKFNVERHGQQTMLRVGVFRPDLVMAGKTFTVAWGPTTGTSGPGVCIAPHAKLGHPFPYYCDTKGLSPDPDAHLLLRLAAEMAMEGAPFALLDAAFLVFPAWRTLKARDGAVAHTPDGSWNPHNPDYPDEILQQYREDHGMFQKRREHDLDKRLPAVEIVTDFATVDNHRPR